MSMCVKFQLHLPLGCSEEISLKKNIIYVPKAPYPIQRFRKNVKNLHDYSRNISVKINSKYPL